MFEKALVRARTRFAKYTLAAREEIYWDDFVSVPQAAIRVTPAPFPHVVIDDFLKPWAYQDLLAEFKAAQARGYSQNKQETGKFRVFDIDYDGYVFMPEPSLDASRAKSLFWSLEWNRFFSRLFNQYTTFETSLAFHHHPPGDRTGFVHHDFADKRFPFNIALHNGVIPYNVDAKGAGYDRRRAISFIFFLNNDGWHEGDGGETGLYANDKKTLVKKVAPLNNRLLAFHISGNSYHAFQGNRQNRNSIVQWLHAPEEDVRAYAQ